MNDQFNKMLFIGFCKIVGFIACLKHVSTTVISNTSLSVGGSLQVGSEGS